MIRLIKRLMQTRQFHPVWIVLAVLAILLVASIVLLPAWYEGSKEPPQQLAPVEPHKTPVGLAPQQAGPAQANKPMAPHP